MNEAARVGVNSPRNVRRRANLSRLVASSEGPAKVAALVETPLSHLSAILGGRRGIGDSLAERIETAFNLPTGGLDDGPKSEAEDLVGELVDVLTPLVASGVVDRNEMVALVAMFKIRKSLVAHHCSVTGRADDEDQSAVEKRQ